MTDPTHEPERSSAPDASPARVQRLRARVRRVAPWAGATLALALVAFALGRCSGERDESSSASADASGTETVYTCVMHPQIRQSEPGRCPICGMDLVPVGSAEDTPLAATEVALTKRAATLARIRTTEVRRLSASGATAHLLGRVDYDESTLQSITTWIGGRIDRLHVRITGEQVRRGQVVATLYSPEVYAAEQDLITAKRQLARLTSGSAIAASSAAAALDGARQRLRLLGVPDTEIADIEDSTVPNRRISIRSPFAGTILERLATEGAYVQTGAPLYRVADLTRLWVQLDAYESDLANLEVGQTVELDVDALPAETFEGRVSFVDPVVDAQRRTARVRIEVSNPERKLRPGMFVEAVVHGRPGSDAAQPLVVPASAPLFTGRRSIVYIEVPDAPRPTYDARVVRLGPRVGDLYPVIAGLSEGERVVIEGAFTLDADLQIRGGHSMMMSGDDTTPGPFDQAIETSASWRAGLRPVIAAYLELHERLADDDLAGANASARELASATAAFAPTEPTHAVEAWQALGRSIGMRAERASGADSLEAVRADFELVAQQVIALLRSLGNPMDVPLRLAFCPMASERRGAEWIQTSESIANPYFGRAMLTCGEIRQTVEPGGYLPAPTPADAVAPARAMAGGHHH